MKRPYTAGRTAVKGVISDMEVHVPDVRGYVLWLNFVMKACLSQSTNISDAMTMSAGEKMLCSIVMDGMTGMNEVGSKEKEEPLSSMRFRMATMVSIRDSWKRSTISADHGAQLPLLSVSSLKTLFPSPAQLIWNRFSFSNFLKTAPLISTN